MTTSPYLELIKTKEEAPAQTSTETPNEILIRRMSAPTRIDLLMNRPELDPQPKPPPKPVKPLTSTDLMQIDMAQARLNSLAAAVTEAMERRGLQHAGFWVSECEDQGLDTRIETATDGTRAIHVEGHAVVFPGRFSHATIKFNFYYSARDQQIRFTAYPRFTEAGHWRMFSEASAAGNRVALWLLTEAVREGMRETGIELELADANHDVSDPVLRLEDLKAIMKPDLGAIYGKDGRYLQEWVYAHWYELTGIISCPVRMHLDEEDGSVEEHRASKRRAMSGESLFSSKAVAAPKTHNQAIRRDPATRA